MVTLTCHVSLSNILIKKTAYFPFNGFKDLQSSVGIAFLFGWFLCLIITAKKCIILVDNILQNTIFLRSVYSLDLCVTVELLYLTVHIP